MQGLFYAPVEEGEGGAALDDAASGAVGAYQDVAVGEAVGAVAYAYLAQRIDAAVPAFGEDGGHLAAVTGAATQDELVAAGREAEVGPLHGVAEFLSLDGEGAIGHQAVDAMAVNGYLIHTDLIF